jgi:hypothetical protein
VEERARLALEELKRVGAFERSVLVVDDIGLEVGADADRLSAVRERPSELP